MGLWLAEAMLSYPTGALQALSERVLSLSSDAVLGAPEGIAKELLPLPLDRSSVGEVKSAIDSAPASSSTPQPTFTQAATALDSSLVALHHPFGDASPSRRQDWWGLKMTPNFSPEKQWGGLPPEIE